MTQNLDEFLPFSFSEELKRNIFPNIELLNLIKKDFFDIFNFSLYDYFVINNKDELSLNFTEIFQLLKTYISINSEQIPIFYYETVNKLLITINKRIEENFIEIITLKSIEEFLEFIPILFTNLKKDKNLLNLNFLNKLCLDEILRTYEILMKFNKQNNYNVNKEKINFYLKCYVRINKTEIEVKNSEVIINEELKINNNPKISLNSSQLLTSKTKKYNNNQYTREAFLNFLSCKKGITEKEIHKTLEKIANTNYEEKRKKHCSLLEYLNFAELKKSLNNHFKNHSVYLIGSCRSGLLYDIKQRPTSIDLLILPSIYHENFNTKQGLSSFIDTFKSLEGLSKIINSIKMKDFLIENIKQDKFIFTFDLKNKNFPDRNSLKINLIFYEEKLKLSSDVIGKYFYKNIQLQSLHMFFQEILISKLNFINSRRDLSNLILHFLHLNYKIFSDTRTHKKCYRLKFKEEMYPIVNNFNAELQEEYKFTFLFEFNDDAFENLKNVSLGELILEFFRYFLNYLQFIKNDYNSSMNKNLVTCKGYEFLKETYDNILNEEIYQFYILTHEMMREFYKISKLEYDMKFCKKVDYLEEIYFKIVENADKIESYIQILENVSELK